MDIVFCEACDGSISTRELEAGKVVRVEGRPYHLRCAPEAARARRVWSRYLAFLLIPPVLGLGYLIGRIVPPEVAPPPADSRVDDLVREVGRLKGAVGGLATTIQATHERVTEEGAAVRTGLAAYGEAIERVAAGVATLVDRIEEVGRALGDADVSAPEAAPTEHEAVRVERALAALRDDEGAADDEGVRFSAVQTLALADDPRARPALRRALGDPAPSVRAYAALHLGQLKDRASGGRLIAMLEDEDRAVRDAAHRALRIVSDRDFPYDALATVDERARQAEAWRKWWQEVGE